MKTTGALLFSCVRCGGTPDYECETAKVSPPRIVKRRGVDVVVQPFEKYHVCARCAEAEVHREDRPRSIVALPHHAALLRRIEADRRREQREALKEAQESMGDDWGRAS